MHVLTCSSKDAKQNRMLIQTEAYNMIDTNLLQKLRKL